jgi:hypothetical protein
MNVQPTSSANVQSAAPTATKTAPASHHKPQAQPAEQKQDSVELSAQAKAALEKQHKGGGEK